MVSRKGPLRVFRFYSRPNLQSTTGAVIGLVSAILPWVYTPIPHMRILMPHGLVLRFDQYDNLLEFLAGSGELAFYGWLFLLGTILALYTPLGGVVQTTGLLGFVLTYRYATVHDWSPIDSALAIGYFLAIPSALMVITNTTTAVRNSSNGRPARVTSRVAAFSPSSLR